METDRRIAQLENDTPTAATLEAALAHDTPTPPKLFQADPHENPYTCPFHDHLLGRLPLLGQWPKCKGSEI